MAIRQRVRKAFSSKEEFKKACQTNNHGTYFNEDLLPSPPCKFHIHVENRTSPPPR